jgi:nucleoside-diphosphate-sugar epimerase
MKQKVLITGGAGYIGSVLTPLLLGEGYAVTVLDNLMYERHTLFGVCSHPDFTFVRGDVRDDRVYRDLIPKHDILIPLAAISGAPACDRDPAAAKAINQDAVTRLNAMRSKSQPVLYPCTNSGYGTRTGEVFCTEETPLEPISVYGVTKVEAERNLLASENTLTLRLATVFGVAPRLRMELLVNQFVWRAFTDGFLVLYEKHFKRNYLHILDAAEGFLYSMRNFDRMKGQPYNLGLEEANLSKEELALKIKEHVPHLYIHAAEVGSDPDKRNYIVANKKINEAGFIARHGLDEGIEQLLKAFRMLKD